MPNSDGGVKCFGDPLRPRFSARRGCRGTGRREEPEIRGFITFFVVGLEFLLADLIERLVITPFVRLFPDRREPVLRTWVCGLRDLFLGIARRLGGAHFDIEPRIPCRPGELMVMNHQSLLDIPIAFAMVPDGYPCMITRDKYGRGIPLVSHNLRLYRHKLVTHRARSIAQFEELAELGRTSDHPVAIFPEGHRTRDGEILPWQKGGLRALLNSRPWRVHVIVLDGLWQSLSIMEFIRHISRVRCTVREAACFEFDPARDDADATMERMRSDMETKLAEMRRAEIRPAGDGVYSAQPDTAE